MLTAQFQKAKIAIIGLGYVGLPLCRICREIQTIGYELVRVDELQKGMTEPWKTDSELDRLVKKKQVWNWRRKEKALC
jgi:UDP-N-acetyl-D-mannosaminuronate dehydrogenase